MSHRGISILLMSLITLVFLTFTFCGPSEIRSPSGMEAIPLENGDILVKNKAISFIISPELGGRVVSLTNLFTGEEIFQNPYEEEGKMGGGFYDITDLIWPGTAERPYKVVSVELKNGKIEVVLKYEIGDEKTNQEGLVITKRFWIDEKSPVIHSEVSVFNDGDFPMKVQYWHQSRPILGDEQDTNKTLWIPLMNEATPMKFTPGSGGHGTDMHPTDGWLGLTGENASCSAVWLFDKNLIQWFWTWHDVKIPTFDILFKPVVLKEGEKRSYKLDFVLTPALPSITGGNIKYDIVSYMNVDVKSIRRKKVVINYGVVNSGAKAKANLKAKFCIEDMGGTKEADLGEEDIPTLTTYSVFSNSISFKLPRLKGGYHFITVKIVSPSGEVITENRKAVKIGKLQIPRRGKPLKVIFLWTLHQPMYYDKKEMRSSVGKFINIYKTIYALYKKHPKAKAVLNVSGILLYQLVKNYPDVVERFRELVKRGQIELVATGFSHPLFPFIEEGDIYMQVYLDKNFKKQFFDVNPVGIHLPEMAYKDGILRPIMANGIYWTMVADIAVDYGYKNLGINYHIPYRIMDRNGGVIKAVVMDTRVMQMLISKTERSFMGFIQYLIELEKKNKKGDLVLAIANNGEFIGNGMFMDKLLTQLEKIPWVKMITGKELFQNFEPVKDLLGDKIYGGWYYDFVEGKATFKQWFDNPEKRKVWKLIKEASELVKRANRQLKEVKELGLDTSYPEALMEDMWERMMVAEESDWSWVGSEYGVQRVQQELKAIKQIAAKMYKALIDCLVERPPTINKVKDAGTEIPPEKAMKYLTLADTSKKTFQVDKINILPERPTRLSGIRVKARVLDRKTGIDYESVKMIFRVNEGKWREIPMKLRFDGMVSVFLGKGETGDQVEFYIYASNLKGKEEVFGPYKLEIF